MGKSKASPKNEGKPLGDFAHFFRWLQRTRFENDPAKLAKAIGKNSEAVRKWTQGANGPRLSELHAIAARLGYADWYELIAAVKRHRHDSE